MDLLAWEIVVGQHPPHLDHMLSLWDKRTWLLLTPLTVIYSPQKTTEVLSAPREDHLKRGLSMLEGGTIGSATCDAMPDSLVHYTTSQTLIPLH